jgi:hypothetical protein
MERAGRVLAGARAIAAAGPDRGRPGAPERRGLRPGVRVATRSRARRMWTCDVAMRSQAQRIAADVPG